MYSVNDWRNYSSDSLYHHGILGMKWGRRNGPPYPLSSSDHSASEKKAGWRDSLDGRKTRDGQDTKKKFKLTDKQKTALKVGGAVLATALVAYGGYKLYNSFDPAAIAQAKKLISDNTNLTFRTSKQKLSVLTKTDSKMYFQKELYDSLSPADKEHLKHYTGGGYRLANKILNGKDVSDYMEWEMDSAKELTKSVTDTLEKCSLKRSMASFRSVKVDAIESMFGNGVTLDDIVKNPQQFIGTRVINKGFYSSTIDPNSYVVSKYLKDDWEHITIKTLCPKGTKAMYVAPISHVKSELELLLQRNTCFEVDDIILNKGKLSELVVRVVEQKLDL